MQQIKDLLPDALKAARPYKQQQKRKQQQPMYARFKLKFYYLDGNRSVHYSYDHYYIHADGKKKSVNDEWMGLKKLIRLMNRTRDKYASCMIWATESNHKRTADSKYNLTVGKFVNMREDEYNETLTFTVEGVVALHKLRAQQTIPLPEVTAKMIA